MILDTVRELLDEQLAGLPLTEKVEAINALRKEISKHSPFATEPVDCVQWVMADDVHANDYNPNSVAPPEMELLRHSIMQDGYTQPIVTWPTDGRCEVVDGFHRNRVGKECTDVRERIHGYLPVVLIRGDRQDKSDRIAATIRHNRARGKHKVEAMSEIVIELKKRNWSDARVAKELGMDPDEVLRLSQISGLTDVFGDAEFSQAWDAAIMEDDALEHVSEEDVQALDTEDGRILHTWDNWECYPAGFYRDKPPSGLTAQDCEEAYRDFLADIPQFDVGLQRVLAEWVNSCEHYLTNEKMNRIAWLGQAAMCIETGIPARFCGGYNLLTDEEKHAADAKALEYLNKWLIEHGREPLDMEAAQSKTVANLY